MIVFKKIKWKNFLSTGNTFTELNLNDTKTNLIIGQNGAGKSTILDALTFSLFGKPFRKINKPSLVNSVNEKDCLTELEFCIGKNNFFIRRGIKPNIFEVWQNGVMLDQSSSAVDYQKQLEQNILKMNYKSFTQIVVLGSSTFVPFMRLPLAQRREIIEDILDIQVFSVMNQRLKDKLKDNTEELKDFEYKINILDEKINLQKSYMLELEKKNTEEIDRKHQKIQSLLEEENENHHAIEEFNRQISEHTENLQTVSTSSEKLKKLNKYLMKIQLKVRTCQHEYKFFNENHVCPTCTQDLSEDFRKEKLDTSGSELENLQTGLQDILSAISQEEQREKKFCEISSNITNLNSKITQLNFQVSSIRKNISDVENEIKNLEESNPDKKAEYNKLQILVNDKKAVKHNLSDLKKDRDVLLVASQLLKDNGIKTRIIKKYLPLMNKLINQYLQNMDFYVNFTLDENFEETIKSRYRDIFTYESFSEGEKARIDIALLLTWRAIAKLKNSVDTNLLILDEIFDGSLDQTGTGELGWILRNFDEKTNVFVISHKESLEGKFDKTIRFSKVKNYSACEETVSEVD